MKKFTSLLLSICFTFMLLSFTINAAETSQDYTSSSTQSSVTKSTFAKQAKEDYARRKLLCLHMNGIMLEQFLKLL